MRLRLSLAAGLIAWSPVLAWADEHAGGEGTVESKLSVYSDDDHTQVVTSIVDGEVGVGGHVVVGAQVLVDMVSSASIDVVSAATGRFDETRLETGGRIEVHTADHLDLTLAAARSAENDWLAHRIQAGVANELAQRNTRLEAHYAFVTNRIGRASDPTFEESLDVHTAVFGASQLLDLRTAMELDYTVQISRGYHSSPYRFVRTADGALSMPEHHPDTRIRHAVGGRIRRYLGADVAAEGGYRFYVDDWGVLSHMLTAFLRYSPGQRWDLRLRVRGYVQGAARFWRKRYDLPLRYMSADRELSTFWDASADLRAAYTIGRVAADVRLEAIRYEFLEYDLLPNRLALVAAGGLSVTW